MKNESYRTLAVRLPQAQADRFDSLMRGRGLRSAAGALRSMIDAALKSQEPDEALPPPPGRPSAKGRTRRLWVHVTKDEAEEIRTIAQPYGGHTAWFRGVLDARMRRATELPAREEIEALHMATVQLGRVATNINQIARALNTSRLAGEPVVAETVRLDELKQLREAIGEVTERVNAVILASRRRVFNE